MIRSLKDCLHLNVAIVKETHAAALAKFGGAEGIRDETLLESAVAAPQATFGGASPYSDVVEVAAAYLYYLCRNHPFIDGNKRVALGACLVFLRLNGLSPRSDGPEWEEFVLAVASSAFNRERTTARLRELVDQPSEK